MTVPNTTTSFPNGFPNGVAIRGIPLLNEYSGNIFWVGPVSQNGSDSNKGTYNQPFLTINRALESCLDNNDDIIFVMPGYTQSISAASVHVIDVIGVSIVGLGEGSDRPTFTFAGVVGANLGVTADNVTIQNVLCIGALNGLTGPINVTGDNFWLDAEWRDQSVTVEAARAVVLTESDNSYIKLKYVGFPAGDTCVNAITANGCDNLSIAADFYGNASTAWVEFITQASTNVSVSGYMYNSDTTNYTKDVIDTITGSTWFALFADGAAGAMIVGGSGAALGPFGAAGGGGGGGATPTEVENIVKAACGTDGTTVVDSATTVLGALGANNANNAFTSDSVVANADGSVLERLETVQSTGALATGLGTTFWVKKTLVSSAILTTGVDITSVSSGGDLAVLNVICATDPAIGLAGGINFIVGSNNTNGLPAILTEAVLVNLAAAKTVDLFTATVGKQRTVLESGKKLIASCTSSNCTGAGTVDIYVQFQRLAAGATVAAA